MVRRAGSSGSVPVCCSRSYSWVDEYDGDPDTENETAILDEVWCQEHLDMERAQAGLEDRANLQEATEGATP